MLKSSKKLLFFTYKIPIMYKMLRLGGGGIKNLLIIYVFTILRTQEISSHQVSRHPEGRSRSR